MTSSLPGDLPSLSNRGAEGFGAGAGGQGLRVKRGRWPRAGADAQGTPRRSSLGPPEVVLTVRGAGSAHSHPPGVQGSEPGPRECAPPKAESREAGLPRGPGLSRRGERGIGPLTVTLGARKPSFLPRHSVRPSGP